jgi:deazaflavin-dependent oxidoreductase (nitroreductase family)
MGYRHADARPFKRALRRAAGWRPVSSLLIRVHDDIDHLSWRLSGGRVLFSSWLTGLPVAMLTTRGARTGAERVSPLLAIPDAGTLLLIGSNYGQARHPGWVHNLRAHPAARIRFESRDMAMIARELEGDERRRALDLALEVYPQYDAYRRRAAPRVIPVFRLEPADR